MTHKTKEIPLEHIPAHKTRRKCKWNRATFYVLKQSLDPVSFLSTLSVYFNLLTNLLKKLFTHGDEISYLFYSLSNFEQYASYPKFHQNCFIKHIFNSFNKYFTPDILLCASIYMAMSTKVSTLMELTVYCSHSKDWDLNIEDPKEL